MAEFSPSDKEELVVGLFDRGIIRFGEFTLKSGRKSPIYYNQRPILSVDNSHEMAPEKQKRIASLAIQGYAATIEDGPSRDHLYGIPQAATSIAAAVAYELGDSYLWGRVGKKDYGKHEKIEGDINPGEKVLQLDDVIVTADSKLESEADLAEAGLETTGFVIMLDRQEGGRRSLAEAGHSLDAVINLSDAANMLEASKRIGTSEVLALQNYHKGLIREGVHSTFSFNLI